MTRPPLPEPGARWALFLDFDGTLVPIVARPADVRWRPGPASRLRRLTARLNGALAVVSGRSIDNLRVILGMDTLYMAGLHGLEWSGSSDATADTPAPDAEIAGIAERIHAWARLHPGIEVEDKRLSVAVHYRRAPHLCSVVRETLAGLADEVGPRFTLQAGKMVLEIRLAGADKGTVIAQIMQREPFVDRLPVFIGDDLTDEAGFEQVNASGGISIKVGAGVTCARFRLSSVTDVWQWLKAVEDRLE